MKLLNAILLCGMMLCASPFASAQAADDLVARQAAAKHYTEVMPMAQMMLEMSEEMTKQMPPEKRDDIVHMMTKELNFDTIQSAAEASLAKNFTVKELQAMTAFAESPEGRSSMKKMKLYMADVMPVIGSEIKRVMDARAANGKK